MIGIYKLTAPNNKIYIGQSINIDQRWEDYKWLRCKGQFKLYNSLIKYGYENYQKEILETCEEDKLLEREVYWKQHYINLYGWNEMLFTKLKDGRGGKLNEETKLKISRANKGKHHSKETKQVISKKLKGNQNWKYRIPSLETNQKISRSKIGYKWSEKSKDKLRKSLTGKKHSFETNKKRSDTMKKICSTEAYRAKCRRPRHNNESKNKIGQINKIKRSIPISQYDINMNLIKKWPSSKEAGKQLNIQNSNINNACNGILKTYKGFVWKKD